MIGFIEQIAAFIPSAPEAAIHWDRIDPLLADVDLLKMKGTAQDPVYHGEGDVYRHTQMVCRELTEDPEFYKLSERNRIELFLAAILHDVGKVKTTKIEDEKIVSPHHASAGSHIARTFLWDSCGICGSREALVLRETVCALIRFHMIPVHLTDQERPEQKARAIAAAGELATDFSWHLLCKLAEADVKGRIADDVDDALTQIEFARMTAAEAGCLFAPYRFADDFTKRAYLCGRNVQPDQKLFDDTWGEVILLSGLPGTGKDTWIRQHHPDLPAVSLDDFRKELEIRPTDDQGKVISAAKERAKVYLRQKRSFIWNATDLVKDTRKQLVELFERYGARVRIVYLETDSQTRTERNAGRAQAVPESAIARMLEKTVPPTADEAQSVEWLCV